MITKALKYLSSLRFTILLISLLGAMFMIGLWVPQIRLVKDLYLEWKASSPGLVAFLDTFGLTYIYTSPITITLWSLFFLNLSLVMWQRLPLIKSRIALTEKKIADPETAGGYAFRRSYPLPQGMSGDQVLVALAGQHYTLLGPATGFYGVKNRLAPIAFGLFHLSFFLILLGGIISMYTEFAGYVDLAQGEEFQGGAERYNKTPRPRLPKFGALPDAVFAVKSIEPHVVRNTPTGIDVRVVDQKGQVHAVDINTPYKTSHTSFVFKHLGMAPLLVVKDSAGKEVDAAYVKLDVVLGQKDRTALGGYQIEAIFYPNYGLEKGKPVTLNQEFKNPMFDLTVARDGKKLARGLVPKGGSLSFEGGRIELQDLTYWVRFYVIKQQGLEILYSGFALAVVGVIWRLLFFRREIIGAVREKDGALRLEVAARSEYYKSLAEDEFNQLFDTILGNRRSDQ
jgi:hypothetical protein